jgi:hypothetical protein
MNNHFLGLFLYDFSIGSLLNYFNTNGQFIKADTIICSDANRIAGKIVATEVGSIVCDFVAYQDMNFDQNITLNFDDHQHSHAVIALRYDPSILEPYPEDTTGVVSHHGLNNPVKLYPNPVANTLFIENEDTPIEHVFVLDITGKEIFHQEIFDNRVEINVSSLPNGMYMVKALCNGSFQISKFVKSKF